MIQKCRMGITETYYADFWGSNVLGPGLTALSSDRHYVEVFEPEWKETEGEEEDDVGTVWPEIPAPLAEGEL